MHDKREERAGKKKRDRIKEKDNSIKRELRERERKEKG